MPSILVDSGAKLLMYGMGELTIVQLYRELAEGKKLSEIHDIRGTCYLTEPKNTPLGAVQCDSFEIVSENKKAYANPAVSSMTSRTRFTVKLWYSVTEI